MEPIHPEKFISTEDKWALAILVVLHAVALGVLVWTMPEAGIDEWIHDILGWMHWTKP